MVVKMYTADGKIRIFRTYNAVGGGDSGPVEYISSCGMKWKKEPEPCQTCSHIDCAIDVQKQAVVELVLILTNGIKGPGIKRGWLFACWADTMKQFALMIGL